jgi:hypothetical protein
MSLADLALPALLAALQVPQASLAGVVRDADSGQPLVGATVVLVDVDRGATSDADGRYEITGVAAGPQHMSISALGYDVRTLHALVPTSGTLEVDVALLARPLPMAPVEVELRAPFRGLEAPGVSATSDRYVSSEAMRNHPGLSEPDALRALSGGAAQVEPEATTGLHAHGGTPDQLAYVLDGIPVFDPVHAAGMLSAWSADALASVMLHTSAPPPSLPDALAGTVYGTVRPPGERLSVASALSTTHGSLTLHGPLAGSAGFVLSLRSGFPGAFAPGGESSYVRGETGDALAKVDMAALGGRVGLLYYESENELTAAVRAESPTADGMPASAATARANFEWKSASAGLVWSRTWSDLRLEARAWRARSTSGAMWGEAADFQRVLGDRDERGVQLGARRGSELAGAELGARLTRAGAWHAAGHHPASPPSFSPGPARYSTTFFAARSLPLGSGFGATLALSATPTAERAHLSPRAELRWRGASFSWSLSAGRFHQFTQSLRNHESVVGQVFPVELATGAGRGRTPVPVADQLVAAAEVRPHAALVVSAQAYARQVRDLLLVAAGQDGPWATGSPPSGSMRAHGLAVLAAGQGARVGWLSSYGWQRVRMQAPGAEYVPRHGQSHSFEGGVVVHASGTLSLRAALTLQLGRKGTPLAGPFEWEACNLLDRGCEFAGTPHLDGALGSVDLPAYASVEMGVRKHWHLRVRGRDATLGAFGTVTNILGRSNRLAYVREASSATPYPVTMRPRSPLVLGVEWRF